MAAVVSLVAGAASIGSTLGGLFGKPKTPGAAPAPTLQSPGQINHQADLDAQKRAAAGASPPTVTNQGGAGGIPTSVLTGDNAMLGKQTLTGR